MLRLEGENARKQQPYANAIAERDPRLIPFSLNVDRMKEYDFEV